MSGTSGPVKVEFLKKDEVQNAIAQALGDEGLGTLSRENLFALAACRNLLVFTQEGERMSFVRHNGRLFCVVRTPGDEQLMHRFACWMNYDYVPFSLDLV